ncbi:MAG TPA: magnesium/cobalt transporter CorA [Euryarchaeota archaeon]|nr:magnesium/cobalt transporter CorA [Euryarchaeota archaeon]
MVKDNASTKGKKQKNFLNKEIDRSINNVQREVSGVQRGVDSVYKAAIRKWTTRGTTRLFSKEYTSPGMPPGTYDRPPFDSKPPIIRVIKYNKDHCEYIVVDDILKATSMVEQGYVTWIDIKGVPSRNLLESLDKNFNMHPLALEDVVAKGHRPKIDEYPNGLYMLVNGFHLNGFLNIKQISLYLGENYLISFQETAEDYFTPIQNRLLSGRGRIRSSGADYLAYAILDLVLDRTFPLLDALGDILETLENDIIENPRTKSIHRIHHIKRELTLLRKGILPFRQIINTLLRGESRFVKDETLVFLKDAYDHSIHIADIIDSYKDLSSGLQDLYISSVSNRTNDVMKVLTIIATIFIPLSFVAGVYGMNFDPGVSPFNMPELNFYFGYPMALMIMLSVALGMLIYFRKKRWL